MTFRKQHIVAQPSGTFETGDILIIAGRSLEGHEVEVVITREEAAEIAIKLGVFAGFDVTLRHPLS